MSKEYNADSITVLEDIVHARKRRHMYLGECLEPSQLFNEILDNAMDEVLNGFSENISINCDYDSNVYSIRDYGRGIPQDYKELPDGGKKRTMEVIYTKLNAGGKFDNNSYKIASGLHGVGSTVTNANSLSFIVKSFRDGNCLEMNFNRGEKTNESEYKTDEKNGTLVQFIPDPEMFESNVIQFSFIKDRCRTLSAFGIKTNLSVIMNSVESEINTDFSMQDLIVEDEGIVKYSDPFQSECSIENGESFKFSLWYTNDTSCKSKGYTNLLYNSHGGTHMRVFYEAFEKAWSKFNVDGIYVKDLYLGLRFVVAAFISETSFDSQTKDKLTVNIKELRKFVDPISEKIYDWLNSDEDFRNGLIKRFQEHRASLNKLLSKKEIKDIVIVNNDSSGRVRRRSVTSKLVECTSRSRDDTEILINEGDSAAGPLIEMRDIVTQAILPLRGKTLNVSKFAYGNEIMKTLKNAEVQSLVNAAGTGILDDCDVSRSRYERYLIATDKDADGAQIRCAVISIFVNLLPNIVKSGMLFIIDNPLYGWYEKEGKNNVFKFCNTQEEIPDYISPKDYHRYKGLGEMNEDQVYQSMLNKETRKIIQVQYPENIDRFNDILTSASVKYDMLVELGLIKYVEE